ncbi:helix-turn-helix domain-containing protein [Mesorhizobium marinum]|uniref:Helix-turn-helix domain-containing protein n=1 Tax=Mesorhizobium marinum TaxID=3228790 RepID=A0ABV3R4C9_9HYPH
MSGVRGELTAWEWTSGDGRHRGFVLESGSGQVKVPEGDIAFASPCLIWLPANAQARLLLNAGSRGVSLAVNEVGLAGAISGGPFAGQMRAALAQPMIHARLEPRYARRLQDTLSAIGEESNPDLPAAQEARRHLLALFFIATWRLSGPVLRETKPLPRTIVQSFLHAVDLHFRDHWTIGRYAQEVGVTADRLNATVRRTTGRSPLSLIHARFIHEADALLESSSLQIAEIAEELGFSDPAYFSRFYKRLSGQPPNRQRREMLRISGRGSFAAWP